MTTTSKLSPFMILLNRAEEKLNKGAFHRHDSIPERIRTHHQFAWTDIAARGELAKVASPLGFGYLQAVLSVLRLFPSHISYDAPGLVGRLEAMGSEMYHLSWNEADGAECLQGGFIFAGKPNYHSPRPVEAVSETIEEKEPSKAPSLPASAAGSPGKPPTRSTSSGPAPSVGTTPSVPTPGMPPSARTSSSRPTPAPTVLARAVHEATETSAPTEDLYGPYLDQVAMAVAQGGSLLLVGPTGTGKSSLLLDAANREGWGVEMIVCHEGKRIHVLQGGHTREVEKEGGDWRFASGPITRLAQRIQRGERVALILDELARAHKEVFAYTMDLLNTYSLRDVQTMMPAAEGDDMKLELPADFGTVPGTRYHILAVDILQRRFVIPTNRLLVTATANQGEQYGGNEFADPAFCRRWTHWLHLAGYDESVIRQILASKCNFPVSAQLFDAILQVNKEVHTYHTREDALKMTLSLPLLINWAGQTIWYYYDLRSKTRSNLQKSFETAARNTWLSRVCPYQGAELDPDVERTLLGFLSAVTLHKLR